jgi:hypothetical protein
MNYSKKYLDPVLISAGIGIVKNLTGANAPQVVQPKPDYTPAIIGVGALVLVVVLIFTLK